jgi:hypothetical protein
VKTLIALISILLVACGGGDYDSRIIQLWANNQLIAQADVESCADTRKKIERGLTGGSELICSESQVNRALPYTTAVKLNDGQIIVWRAPAMEKCNQAMFLTEKFGAAIQSCVPN